MTCKNQWQSLQYYLYCRAYQLALFRLLSDSYMYLAALPLSAMSQAAHTLASKVWVVEQSLSLSNLGTGYREEQRTETPFLRKPVLLPCFMAVFFPSNKRHPSSTTRFSTTSLATVTSIGKLVIHKETIV